MRRHTKRGAVGIGMVVALVVIEVIIVVSVIGGTHQQDLTLQRLDTNRAFYAAEGGLALSVREIWTSSDEDGDGTVGSISDDGNSANDPVIGSASVFVSKAPGGGGSILSSRGSANAARRSVELDVVD